MSMIVNHLLSEEKSRGSHFQKRDSKTCFESMFRKDKIYTICVPKKTSWNNLCFISKIKNARHGFLK
jgi:hypothetical protein